MGFKIQFDDLLNLTVRHCFHLNGSYDDGGKPFSELEKPEQVRKLSNFDVRNEFKLLIPSDTQRVLSGLGCVYKQIREGVRVAIEVGPHDENAKGKACREIPERFALRFIFTPNTGYFFNYTNLRVSAGHVVYLSNKEGFENGNFYELSKPELEFDSEIQYQPGDVVRASHPAPKRFVALKGNKGKTPTESESEWKELPANERTVGSKDEIPLVSGKIEFKPPSDLEVKRLTIKGLHLSEQEINDLSQESIEIDLSDLPPGRYEVIVEGQNEEKRTFPYYVDPTLVSNRPSVIVEFIHEPEMEGSRLFEDKGEESDPTQVLRNPKYLVRFLNQHTFWRYNSDKGSDTPHVLPKARPLTRDAQRVEFENTLLPNPAVDQPFIVDRTNQNERRLVSDVYVPFLPKSN